MEVLARRYFSNADMARMQSDLRLQTEERSPSDIVLLDMEVETAFGNGEQMFDAFLEGKVAIQKAPEKINNRRTNLYAPIEANPVVKFRDYYPIGREGEKILQQMAPATLLVDALTRQVGTRIGILDPETYELREDIDPDRVGTWIGGGLSPADGILDTHYAINFGTDKYGNPLDKRQLSDPFWGTRNFPQDLSSRPSMTMKSKGSSGTIMAACSTSLANGTIAFDKLRAGELEFAAFGAVEYCFNTNVEDAMKYFSLIKSTSTLNDDPEHASRPFDIGRTGLVPGSAAGIGFYARRDAAERYGFPYRAVVLNSIITMDGGDATMLNSENVARTIAQTCYLKEQNIVVIPDAIIAHATSTPQGDRGELQADTQVLGSHLSEVPITSNKGGIGHTMGASGMVSTMEGVIMSERGLIPHTTNLEEPDREFEGTDLVMGEPRKKMVKTYVIQNFGFGGNNAVTLFEAA